jgi:hypothetical protein
MTASPGPGDASITVQWSAPLSDNGSAITGYIVAEASGQLPDREVDASFFTVTFESLSAGTYRFVAQAVNSAGISVDSEATLGITIAVEPTPVSGAPGDQPAPENGVGSSVDLPEGLTGQIAAQIGQDGGFTLTPNGSALAIVTGAGGLAVKTPFTSASSTGLASATFSIDFPAIAMEFADGSGTIEFPISEQVSVIGTGRLGDLDGSVAVMLDSLKLVYSPPADEVSGASVTFEVDLLAAPASGKLDTAYLFSVDDMFGAGTNTLLVTDDGSGSSLSDSPADFGAAARVTKTGLTNSALGTSAVVFNLPATWVQGRLAAGREIVAVKVADSGVAYTRAADCKPEGAESYACSATFSGAAGGFSTFGLLAFVRPALESPTPVTGAATPTTASTAVTGTAAPSPTPTSSAGVVNAPGDAPTATAETLPLPTPALEGAGGGSRNDTALIISLAIIVGVTAAGFGGYWLRTHNGHFKVIVLIGGLSAASLIALSFRSTGTEAAGDGDGERSRIDPALFALSLRQPPASQRGLAAVASHVESLSANTLAWSDLPGSSGYVLVSAASSALDETVAELAALGMADITMGESSASGWLPLRNLQELSSLPSRPYVRLQYPSLNSGAVQSAGDEAMRADVARAMFGLDGSGVKVGVISDSYDCLDGAATDVADGELPASVVVLEEYVSCSDGIDEGRAMMQLIYDLAPGVEFLFHSGFNGAENMAQGIIDLADAGADVIVDDVSYFNSPFFQDGIIGEAVDQVVADGVVYFSSAGNYGRQSYEADYSPGPTFGFGAFPSAAGAPPFLGGTAHDFGSGEWQQAFSLSAGASLTIVFQWEDSFLSQNGVGAATEMDLYIFDSSDTVVAGSIFLSQGSDPIEFISVTNVGGSQFNGSIALIHADGPAPAKVKHLFRGSGVSNDALKNQAFPTYSGTVFGHANSSGAIAVGAVDYLDTAAFGGTPEKERFSSSGGVPILRDAAGVSIPAVVREKPDIMAADGSSTTVLDPFFGTSAAAPHAAAIAALILQDRPGLSPAEIRDALQTSAVDMDAGGFDFTTGYGLADGVNALSRTAFVSSMVSLSYDINDMVVDQAGSLVYITVDSGLGGGEVIAIDPLTGEEAWVFNTGFVPSQIAVSDDGAFAYVAEDGTGTIWRIDIAEEEIDLEISLGVRDSDTAEYGVEEIEVMPGSPETIAVSTTAAGEPETGVFLFVDGIQSANSGDGGRIEFASDSSSLFSLSGAGDVRRYDVDVDGLSLSAFEPGALSDSATDIEYEDGLLFATSGEVADAISLSVVDDTAAAGGFGPLEPDVARDCVYFLRTFTGPGVLLPRSEARAYDMTSGDLLGSFPLPGPVSGDAEIERWGSQGFAILTASGELLIGSFELVSPLSPLTGSITVQGVPVDVLLLKDDINLSAFAFFGLDGASPVSSSGEFQFDLLAGQYDITVLAPGFVSASATGVRLDTGPLAMSDIELAAGDVNGDDKVDAADAEALVASFGLATTDRRDGSGEVVDIDASGYVTGRDASLLSSNFGMAGPLEWAPATP